MAIGEAACVSVHGANRLGSNSLLDLVVFGRAAAHRAAELTCTPGAAHVPLPNGAGEDAVEPPRPAAPRQGPTPDRRSSASRCSAPCRTTARCSAPARSLRGGRARSWPRSCEHSRQSGVTDRSLIWNSDLVETLELENLLYQAVVTIAFGREPHRKAAAPTRARTSPSATTRTG